MNCVLTSAKLDELLARLGAMTAPFEELPPGVTEVNTFADGYPVIAGEVNNLAHLLEDGGTAFAICWGLLAPVARELDALVIGSVYDAMEEHCELFVARGSEIIRAFWSNPRRATKPFSQGAPLSSEQTTPLSAAGGAGLAAALQAFGFPLAADDERLLLPTERWVLWKGDIQSLTGSDELRDLVNDHIRAFSNPAYQSPVPTMRVRRTEQD